MHTNFDWGWKHGTMIVLAGTASRGSTIYTMGGAQSTAYPMGKSYAIGRLLGLKTHAMAPADDPCTMGI